MIIRLDRSGAPAALADLMLAVAGEPGVQGLMVLACDANGFTPDQLDGFLQEMSLPVFGGVFPGIFYQRESLSKGSLVVGFSCPVEVAVVDMLGALDDEVARCTPQPLPPRLSDTQILFLDAFTPRIDPFIDTLFDHQGLVFKQIGAGAGSLSFVQKPCIVSNRGLLQDAAVLARLSLESRLGMAHGWQIISESIKVTGSRKNEITHLDHRPAAEVYGEIVMRHGGRAPDRDDFLSVAKAYPFGICKLGSEVVVRDPLGLTPSGGITSPGQVAVGTFLHVLHGQPDDVIGAAARAAEIAQGDGGKARLRLFFNCLSRPMFLEARQMEELDAVQGPETLIGVHAVGEICNMGADYPEFHNKTAVLGLLGRAQ